MNVYRTSDDNWFMLVVTPDKLAALAEGIGRADLLSDARFSDAAKAAANMAQLTAILDEVFCRSRWRTGTRSSSKPTSHSAS